MRQLGGPREVVVHHACAGQQSSEDSLAGHAAVPGERRRRDVHTRLRRRPDGARRARFLVVCKYEVVSTSNARPARPRSNPAAPAARPRRRHLCATQGTPHDAPPGHVKGGSSTDHDAQRAPQVFGCRQHCVRLCWLERPVPASWLHRSVQRRHSSSQRPEGQPSRLPKGSTGRQEKTDEDYRTGTGRGARH